MRAAIGLEEQAPISQTRAVIYARVSTRKQADSSSLTRQEEQLVTYAVKQGYQVVASLTEIASGINKRRPQLDKGLQLIAEKKANTLVVEFKDRLARFGYDYLELFITTLGGRIEVIETTETTSPNEELVEDLIAIITSFSARIYGKRGKLAVRLALRRGMKVVQVNPAYTSVIGKYKYALPYGMSGHEAAAFVIARRGQGWQERLPKEIVLKLPRLRERLVTEAHSKPGKDKLRATYLRWAEKLADWKNQHSWSLWSIWDKASGLLGN